MNTSMKGVISILLILGLLFIHSNQILLNKLKYSIPIHDLFHYKYNTKGYRLLIFIFTLSHGMYHEILPILALPRQMKGMACMT
jgi:hypothetical protein